jgi:hypothetical protein
LALADDDDEFLDILATDVDDELQMSEDMAAKESFIFCSEYEYCYGSTNRTAFPWKWTHGG